MFVIVLLNVILHNKLFMDKNIRISEEVHSKLVSHIPPKIKIGYWIEEAIVEKICRENPDGKECTEPLTDKKK